MPETTAAPARHPAGRLRAELAGCGATVVESQELRYRVLAGEFGTCIERPGRRQDEDHFDRYCKHLAIRDKDSGEVVGTCRILTPEAARRAGGYYAQRAFDLSRLECQHRQLAEIGRACVHPDYVAGAVLRLLWSALARYVNEQGFEYVMGSIGMSLAGGGDVAASIYRLAARRHMSPVEYRVFPRCRLPLEELRADLPTTLPLSLRGYLNVGAWVSGEPARDADLNCAEMPILLPMSRMHARFARHFLEKAA